MRKQIGRNLLATYQAPLLVAGILAVAIGVDYRFHSSNLDAYSRGQLLLTAHKYEAAISEFSTALRLNPADAAARLGLGQAYQAIGWIDQATKQYEMSAQKSGETLKQSYLNLGALAEKLGHKDDAKRFHLAAQNLAKEAF